MSIIADTLKRLQARSTATTPKVPEEPSLRAPFNQGEGAGRHLKNSRIKFWMIGIGLTLGLGGLALSAFWIGWHLDFGFSTNTQARMTNNRPVPTSPLWSELQGTVPTPSETVVAAIPKPQVPREHTSQVSIAPIVGSPTQHTSPTPTSMKSQPVVTPPEPPVLGKLPDQKVQSASVDAANTDREPITLGDSRSEEPTAPEESVHRPTPAVEPPHIVEMAIAKPEGSQTTHPGAVALEEEIVHTEDSIKTVKLSTNPTLTPSSLTAMKRRREAMNPADQTRIPLQPSPANRLRHAKQLIRSGQYEDAVTLLSPLFHDPPVKWQPWFWMGTALLGKGDTEQADQFFLSGLARNDKVPQLWIQRALVAQQRGNFQLAIHELRQAESLEANIPHIHLNMGYAYERLGNDRLANQYYGKFLKLSEGKPAFFSTRKKLFARLTQQAQAERPLSPSASASPNP